MPNLSRDGKHVAFSVLRAGSWELWEKSLVDGREAPIIADEHSRAVAQWSPDGLQLVYIRPESTQTTPQQLMIWSSQTRSEEPLTTLSETRRPVYNWSPDGASLLVGQDEGVWLLPMAAAPHAETADS